VALTSFREKTKNHTKMQGRRHRIRTFVILVAFLAAVFACLLSGEVRAAAGINRRINFQGKVVNGDGTNVTNGSYPFVFKIYSVANGGSPVWTETKSLTVTDGIFQTDLGDTAALPGSVDFNTDNIYLGVTFNNDGEMAPRIRFDAVLQAFNAQKVSGLTVTDTTGTLTVPNGKTIAFGDAFTTAGAHPLTLTTVGATSVTLPTGGVLLTSAASSGQAVVSTQTSGTVLGVSDVATPTGSLTGGSILLNGAFAGAQTGLSIDLTNGLATSQTGLNIAVRNANANALAVTDGSNTNATLSRDGLLALGRAGAGGVTGGLKFFNSANANSVLFRPSVSQSQAAIVYTLPTDDGSANQVLQTDGSGGLSWTTVSGGGYSTFQDEGTALAQRTAVNFTGGGVSCVDNAGLARTDCTINGGASSLQAAYDGGASIETSGNSLVITETGATIQTQDLVQIAAGASVTGFSGDLLQLTMDAANANGFSGDGLKIVVDQSQVDFSGRAINVEDDTGKEIFTVGKLGFVRSTRGFVSYDGYLGQEFNDEKAAVTADSTIWGDDQTWVAEEGTCQWTVPEGPVSVVQQQAVAAATGCYVYPGLAAGDVMQFTSVANLPRVLIKMKVSAADANNDTYAGLTVDLPARAAGGTGVEPGEGVYFTNADGGTWKGRINPASGASTDISCTGATISASEYALLEIIHESSTAVRFKVDPNMSDGINPIDCGTGNPSGVTSNLGVAVMLNTGAALSTVQSIDYVRVWTDDPVTQDAAVQESPVDAPLDPLASADVAEAYLADDAASFEEGDVVAIDESGGVKVRKSLGAYDRNLMGVITTSPYQVMGAESKDTVRVGLSGRVPVKVNLEGGPILPGDYLTSSSVPGTAMKATKAGAVIGRAMEAYAADEPSDKEGANQVMMFIEPSMYTGRFDPSDGRPEGVALLSRLLERNAGLPEGLSAPAAVHDAEVFADRLIAQREVVASRVTAETIFARSLSSLPGENLSVGLADDSFLAVKDLRSGVDGVRIDGAGNATFAGTVTAGKVRADQIEGLEVVTDRLRSLDSAYRTLVSEEDTQKSQPADVRTDRASVGFLRVEEVRVALRLDLDGQLTAEGLTVKGKSRFKQEASFEKLASFLGGAFFRDPVIFDGVPTFGKDTAGMARIRKGSRRVDVEFGREYESPPVVQVTLTADEDDGFEDDGGTYAVSNRSAKGFSIILDRPASKEKSFSWMAVSVVSPRTFKSLGDAVLSVPEASRQPSETVPPLPAVSEGRGMSEAVEGSGPMPGSATPGPVLPEPSETGSALPAVLSE
jgi:hypothetical protein